MFAFHSLGRYFGGRYIKSFIGVLALCIALLFTVDVIELIRRSSDKPDVTMATLLWMSFLRVPSLSEQLFPFAVLFGSIASLLALSRKLELTVTRAIGVSVWQFLSPALLITGVIGLVLIMGFNPLAAVMKERSDAIKAEVFGSEVQVNAEQGQWIRQNGPDGEAIIRAGDSHLQGRELLNVSVFTYDHNDSFVERIDAERAELQPGHWLLTNVQLTRKDGEPIYFDSYSLSTFLSEVQLREHFAVPESVPFWSLPQYINIAESAGLPAHKYRLQFQTLLARPLLLCAMVLIAATVSLRVFRYGGIGKMILSGILAGFVLYVATELAEDLGGAGVIPPVVAAWAPGIVATFLGLTVLLHLEDG